MLATSLQRIMVIDDDPAILRMVGDKLDRSGYQVLTAASGLDALALIQKRGLPHLAIVDINMPGLDGFGFCRTVQSFSDLPIIMLTAHDEEETIVQAIELYAEDYVTKPFSPRELVARVQRVLRRIGDFAYALEPITAVDNRLAVDFAQQQALLDGQAIALTQTQTKLLYILMRNAGRTVTTEFLLHRLWPLEEVFEDALRVHIHRLRKKIDIDPKSPYIITERGQGYRFVSTL